MNKEYPTSLVLSTVPAGVIVDKMKQTMKDAAKWEEAGGEFDVAYTAAEAGKKTVSGEIKFAVCSANTCDPEEVERQLRDRREIIARARQVLSLGHDPR